MKTNRVPAGKSARLTAGLVALVERCEPDPGPEPGTIEHTEADFDSMARTLLADCETDDLWVFAYGSLIWNPEIVFTETCAATAHGWHRAFCLKLTRWRGTREQPALMLALDRGGSCQGLAYRVPQKDRHRQLIVLLQREIDANPPTNVPRWVWVRTDAGMKRALAFVADPGGAAYAGKLSDEHVAWVIARAAGHWGSAAQYLLRTITMLEEHGIRDRNLWRIQALVASEIESFASAAGPEAATRALKGPMS